MIKKLLAFFIVFAILFPTTSAYNKDEMLLYKAITLSRAKIEKDFPNGKQYNSYIKTFFDDLRKNNDIKKVRELDERLQKIISKYNSNPNDRNYNLALNIYYRNKLLKDYLLKWVKENNSKNTNSNNDNSWKIIIWNNNNSWKVIIENKNNSISEIISKWDQNLSKNNKGSTSYSYKVINWWNEEKVNQWETILTKNGSKKDTIVMIVANTENWFSKFKSDFRDELLKNGAIRNFSDNYVSLNWKSWYKFSYNLNNDEKTIYLIEGNNMALVVNVTKKEGSDSQNQINEIINSIKIN